MMSCCKPPKAAERQSLSVSLQTSSLLIHLAPTKTLFHCRKSSYLEHRDPFYAFAIENWGVINTYHTQRPNQQIQSSRCLSILFFVVTYDLKITV